MRSRPRILAGAIAAALMLAACGGGSSTEGSQRFTRGIGADPKSIDPHRVEGTWANDVIGDMFIGLFTENANPNPCPASLKAGSSSEDQLTWTFKLKQTTWSDGTPLTLTTSSSASAPLRPCGQVRRRSL